MNTGLIKLWIEGVGIDEVLKNPAAMMLMGGAKKWAEGTRVGMEFERDNLTLEINEMNLKKAKIIDDISKI